ncbi:MAG: acetylornithine deacetylase [Pseudomonadota bacterium]
MQSHTDILKALVAFDTVSRNSNLPLIAWIEDYLASFGIESRRVYDETGQKANLWATIGPDGPDGVILSGHTDVVPVDGQDWATDPFDLTEVDGSLYGRGACDMKGFVACVLASVPAMVRANLRRPIHLAFSYDEEVGCIGVRTLLADLRDKGQQATACIVGEPTEMQVVIGHKSKKSMLCEVTGKTAHSSLAPQGVNAADYAAMLVVKIREMADRLATNGKRDSLYDVPFTTGHTGIFASGTALNIVPESARVEFEFRAIAEDDAAALVDEVIAYARDTLEPRMKAVAPETGFAFTEKSYITGLETEPDAPVVAYGKRLAKRNDHAKVAYGTEGGLFTAYLGVPTIVCGPGSIEQAHKANEFVPIGELDRCMAFLADLTADMSGELAA